MSVIIVAGLAGAAQAAAHVRRREIGIAGHAVMIVTSAAVPVAVHQVRVDAVQSRAVSVARAASVMNGIFASSVRRSRRRRAFPW